MSPVSRHESIDRDSLWMLTFAPAIWGAHFLLSYITAALWCAKFAGPRGTLAEIHPAIAWYTTAALVGIIAIGWTGYRRHRHGTETTTHDLDTPEDRYRFIGFMMLLLSCLSAIAVIYVAFASTLFTTC
jgi:hypothetical protein